LIFQTDIDWSNRHDESHLWSGCDVTEASHGRALASAFDLDERRGLAGCASRPCDAEALQLYETDHAGLSGLQPAKQIVHRDGAYRGSSMILDRYFVVERQCGESRRVTNPIDPLVA
jgi:hypothetical protein